MLDVCCNDADSGLFRGRAVGVSIGEIELEAGDWVDGVRFELTDAGFRMSKKNWPVQSSKDWVGNWCWNRYELGDGGARTPRWWLVDFLKWMRARRLFRVISGPTRFCRWYDDQLVLSDAELYREICVALGGVS